MTCHNQQSSSLQTKVAVNGTRIKQIRELKGLTQLYLATTVEVTVDTISRWENNRSPNIKRENAEKLAKALEVPIEDITADTLSEQTEGNKAAPSIVDTGTKKVQYLPAVLLLCTFTLSAVLYILWPRGQNLPLRETPPAPAKGEVQAGRYLPGHTPPGQPFPVVIKIKSSIANSTSFILKEALPSSCTVSRGKPAFVLQNGGSAAIKWLSSIDREEERYFAYLASTDESVRQGQILNFSGQLKLNDKEQDIRKIKGMNKVTIMNYHWADSNRDHRIDDSEILAIYNLFEILQDLGIDLAQIRRFWASTKGYRWNRDHGVFEVVQ